MPAFEPVGAQARWRIVYDLLCAYKYDEVLTYEVMGDALGLDPETDRHKIQMAMRRAAQEHEEVDKRAVDSVPNQGYRIVRAPEHVPLARRQQKRSSRALMRGHSKAVNVDLSGVDKETRAALDVVARGFALQMDFNRRVERDVQRHDEAIEAAYRQMGKYEERLGRLERQQERPEESS